MSKIEKFQDLECWKAARVLVKLVYENSADGFGKKDWDTTSQFRRAGLSVMNNIAEGFGRYSEKDSVRFFDISKASGFEVKSMLYVLEDVNYLDEEKLTMLHKQVDKAVNLTLGFIKYLKSRKLE